MDNTFSIKNSSVLLSLNSMRIGLPLLPPPLPPRQTQQQPPPPAPPTLPAPSPPTPAPPGTITTATTTQPQQQPLHLMQTHNCFQSRKQQQKHASPPANRDQTVHDDDDADSPPGIWELAGIVSFWCMFLLGFMTPREESGGEYEVVGSTVRISSLIACMLAPALGVYMSANISTLKSVAVALALSSCCGSMWIRDQEGPGSGPSTTHYAFILEKSLTLAGLLASSTYVGITCMESVVGHGVGMLVYGSSILMQAGLALLGVAIQDPAGVLLAWGAVAIGTLVWLTLTMGSHRNGKLPEKFAFV